MNDPAQNAVPAYNPQPGEVKRVEAFVPPKYPNGGGTVNAQPSQVRQPEDTTGETR